MKMLHAKVSWLKKQWGESGITGTEENALNVTVADGGQLLFSGNVVLHNGLQYLGQIPPTSS